MKKLWMLLFFTGFPIYSTNQCTRAIAKGAVHYINGTDGGYLLLSIDQGNIAKKYTVKADNDGDLVIQLASEISGAIPGVSIDTIIEDDVQELGLPNDLPNDKQTEVKMPPGGALAEKLRKILEDHRPR